MNLIPDFHWLGIFHKGHFQLNFYFFAPNGLKITFWQRGFFMYRGVPTWGTSSPQAVKTMLWPTLCMLQSSLYMSWPTLLVADMAVEEAESCWPKKLFEFSMVKIHFFSKQNQYFIWTFLSRKVLVTILSFGVAVLRLVWSNGMDWSAGRGWSDRRGWSDLGVMCMEVAIALLHCVDQWDDLTY